MKVAIIEDEKPAARLLHAMLERLRPDWSVELAAGSVSAAVKWFESHEMPDLLFLDIQLSDGNSFVFLEQVNPSCPIVFTTAYDEYAIRAFAYDSIDYLLKPFDTNQLEEAIRKFEAVRVRQVSNDLLVEALLSISRKEKRYRTRFLIAGVNARSETLQVEDVAYFFSVNRISFVVCKNGAERVVDLSLDKLSEQLDPDRFFRANRQFILNVDAVQRIEPYFGGKIVVSVLPGSKEKITISKEKAALFRQWLDY